MSQEMSGTMFYGLMRLRLTSTKVMERAECAERRDLLMIEKKLICEAWWRNCHGWTCMAASGVGSLIYIYDVTHDGSSRMNSEDKNIPSANWQELHHAGGQ